MSEHERPRPVVGNGNFQDRVRDWTLCCLGGEKTRDPVNRSFRFLEEALELVQVTGCTREEAHQLVDYVFERPVGELVNEMGGALLTLVALATAMKLDCYASGELE